MLYRQIPLPGNACAATAPRHPSCFCRFLNKLIIMSNPRILVVDDDPNLSGLVRLILQKTQRFDVRVENRSALALQVAREYLPHLVLLDVDMPGKDGGEVSREIRADPVLRDVPVIFFTSLISRAEAGEREVVRGGMRFLAKPVIPKVLVETVDRVLAESSCPI
jgi:CheY-like chemotaxis protein